MALSSKGSMNRSHITTSWADTQPYAPIAPASGRRVRARRRTMLTLACLAAGVGGTAFKMMPVAVKPASTHAAPVAQTVPAAPVALAPAVQATATDAVQQAAAEAQQGNGAQQGDVAQQPIAIAPRTEELRSQLRWVKAGGAVTLDAQSRLLLARSAAQSAGLHEVGLDYRDVYGVIHAESSWIARDGMGKNGVTSLGLAQFEPATARAVGLRDPHDPVEAVFAAAAHLKDAARWSANRLERLHLDADEWASKLREGVSVYYNLSSRGRAAWQGLNSDQMPVETRLHIRNVRAGALKAAMMTTGTAGLDTPTPAVALIPAAMTVMTAARAVTARDEPIRVAARANAAPAGRVQATFSAAPRHDESKWVRTRDSISMPEGSIRWTARETAASGG